MIFLVKIIPNAPKNQIEGLFEGVLKVRIQSIPEKGKANEELLSFLAKTFEIRKSQIRILSGHTSRLKKIEVDREIDLASKKSSTIC